MLMNLVILHNIQTYCSVYMYVHVCCVLQKMNMKMAALIMMLTPLIVIQILMMALVS